MTNKLADMSSKDLEAKIKERETKLHKILAHVKNVNPINMHWSRPPFLLNEVQEYLENGGVKLKGYHGFDITERYHSHFSDGAATITLEYKGKVVLKFFYENHYKDLSSGMRERIPEIRTEIYEEGAWEDAFDKIIKMGLTDALNSFTKPFYEAEEKKKQAEIKAFNKKLERNSLETKAHSLGI